MWERESEWSIRGFSFVQMCCKKGRGCGGNKLDACCCGCRLLACVPLVDNHTTTHPIPRRHASPLVVLIDVSPDTYTLAHTRTYRHRHTDTHTCAQHTRIHIYIHPHIHRHIDTHRPITIMQWSIWNACRAHRPHRIANVTLMICEL